MIKDLIKTSPWSGARIMSWKQAKDNFHFLGGINRTVESTHVDKIARSIKRWTCLRPVVVTTVNFINDKNTTYIIDGQHAFTGMVANKINVPYIEVEIKTPFELVECIAMFNASSKSWSMSDYILAWSYLVSDYKKLLSYISMFKVDVSLIAAILSGKVGYGGKINTDLKTGAFKIRDEENNAKLLGYLNDVLYLTPSDSSRHDKKYFCTEYVTFCKMLGSSYNHTLFMSKVKTCKEFDLASQEVGKLVKVFEKVYS